MKVSAQALLDWRFDDVVSRYDEKDTMLYALGVGLGADPVDAGQLRYVYERDLRAMPTMAVTLGHPGPWTANPEFGINRKLVVHAGQSIEIHRPLPAAGTVRGRNRIVGVSDKGAGRGALIVTERRLHDEADGAHLATLHNFTFCRGDGGCGSAGDTPAPVRAMPSGEPDHVVELPIWPAAALLYRLSGDRNPLHADPELARQAGFPKPIVHGLLSYAMACHAIGRAYCRDYDMTRVCRLDARLSAPVYPGEVLSFRLWQVEDAILFQGWTRERNTLAVDGGFCRLAP